MGLPWKKHQGHEDPPLQPLIIITPKGKLKNIYVLLNISYCLFDNINLHIDKSKLSSNIIDK
jgi:hypothetical protein